jgi:hypothetical protein
MNRQSQASKRVVDIFKSDINELYTSVYNTVHYELTKESAQGFSDGWTEAMVWMRSHPDCTISEDLEAKYEQLRNRYPCLKTENENA